MSLDCAENKRKRQDSVKAGAPAVEAAAPAATAADSDEPQAEPPAKDPPEAASPPKRPRTSEASDDENDSDSGAPDAGADAAVPAAAPVTPTPAPATAEAKPVGIADAPVFGMSFASARALGGFAAAAKAVTPLKTLASAPGCGFAKYASAASPKGGAAAAADAAAEEPATGRSERTFEDMLTAEGKESLADNAAMSTVVPAMAHANMAELQAEPVRTYEEDETCVFSTKAKLFELADNNWKERGGGHFKLNRHNDCPARCRLVMRTDQTFRLILNVPLFPEMKLSHDRRFVRFTCLNTESMAPATYVLRFASEAMATDAHRCIAEAIPAPDDAPAQGDSGNGKGNGKGKGVDTSYATGSEDEEDDEDYEDEGSSSDEEEEGDDQEEDDDDDDDEGGDDECDDGGDVQGDSEAEQGGSEAEQGDDAKDGAEEVSVEDDAEEDDASDDEAESSSSLKSPRD
ncbi:hypothetical protein H4R21_000311 [Coemansia helicoidea]|uniref:Uncharacterized protein n=1 Tax=Coemansia helicoidea TaxID=1286919 RepID=A0ACC1LGJ9_9FUNG|nr:hypothetical protein H4R21_000311 [Coemansia helicoidea]